MPAFSDGGAPFDVSRAAMMVDTNVLVSAFSPKEADHDYAKFLLENPSEFDVAQWLIPTYVIVEAWGMLTRSKDDRPGNSMLTWLFDAGNPVAFCRYSFDELVRTDRVRWLEIVRQHHVDVVDALLLIGAEEVTRQCSLNPPVVVATSDMRDFSRLKRTLGGNFRIFHLQSLELEG